jgi:hypothetical protein
MSRRCADFDDDRVELGDAVQEIRFTRWLHKGVVQMEPGVHHALGWEVWDDYPG